MTEIAAAFGAAVRRRRERLGLSQEAFADRAGVHRTYVSAIELGKVQVSIGIAYKITAALGVPLSHVCREIEKRQADGGSGSTESR